METIPADLMSRPSREDASASHRSSAGARTWPRAFGDAFSFALVGIALVGSVFESLDIATDNPRGVQSVAAGAAIGALASAVYGHFETSRERIARVRRAR